MSILLTDLIFQKKQFLSEEQCNFLIEEFEKEKERSVLEHCPDASTNIDTYSTFNRVDLKIGTEGWQIVHDATERLINEYHDYLDGMNAFHKGYRNALKYSHMIRLLKYETGAKIHPHSDHSMGVYGSATFNLNDGYTGGEFAWFRGKHKVSLGKGDALIFPADYFWVHEVTEVMSGVRYSTNSFLQQLPTPVLNRITDGINFMLKNRPDNPEILKEIDAFYNIKSI